MLENIERNTELDIKTVPNLTAVIDIGSNSIRLVVFDGPTRVPLPKFNEKVLCGLGKDLGSSQLLSSAAMNKSMMVLKRYAALATHMGVDRVLVAATAAVREADNGAEFVAEIEQECDLNVQVLSGKQEARYAGLGVLFGMPFANGLVGDLGGGSLELVKVGDHKIGDTATLPLGALRLSQMNMSDEELSNSLHHDFSQIKWLEDVKGKNFYVVGGAWRALARYHIKKTHHPLNIIHNYKLSLKEMQSLIKEILSKSDDELGQTSLVSKSRIGTLRTAASIMDQLFQIIQPKSVIFSANGLREGMIFSELKKPVRKRDPLLETCRDMAAKEGRFREHGDEIYNWLKPVMSKVGAKGQRLALAASILSDIAWSMNSDYRAAQAFRRIFRAPFSGIGHKGRAIVALAVYARYRGNCEGHAAEDGMSLLSEIERQSTLSLGLALRLSHTLSGGARGLLPKTKLLVSDQNIILTIPEELSVMLGVHVKARLEALANSQGKTGKIRIIEGQ